METLHRLLTKQSDVLLVIAVMGILLILIIPFPPMMLDFFLCLNISLAILLLLITLNLKHALEFSAFPSILLIATLFRLALNVASTRLILLKAYAGTVIQAFGFFVVGGDPLVGMIIFLILIVIQFIVITKGSNRISEVAARFTLDAMPGKQMSIDADLNSGSIDEKTARKRRKEITQEAEFYGAMDGAGKFVRGDAIAGIVITIINIIGGFILGVRKGIPIEEALRTYIILTVGDGLVSQIPALLIAVTTGMLTTKASSESSLAEELQFQFTRYPKAIGMTAAVILAFGLMPGLPFIPFFVLSLFLASLTYYQTKVSKTKVAEEKEEEAQAAIPREDEIPPEERWLSLDRIRIELGYKLIDLADPTHKPTLMDRIVLLREQLAREIGILAPPVHIVDNMHITPHDYIILLEGEKVARSTLYPGHYLAIDSGADDIPRDRKDLGGIDTREPAFGLKAKWIDPTLKEQAELAGYAVINAVSVLITHISEILKQNSYKVLSREDVNILLELTKKQNPSLVENLVPEIFSLTEIHRVLQNLLWEKISILNLPRILEVLSLNFDKTRDANQLTELVRQHLCISICAPHQTSSGLLPVITLDPQTEQNVRGALVPSAKQIPLAPDFLQKLLQSITNIKNRYLLSEGDPVLLVNADIRRGMKELVYHTLPNLAVLSFQEVMQVPEIKCIGMAQVK